MLWCYCGDGGGIHQYCTRHLRHIAQCRKYHFRFWSALTDINWIHIADLPKYYRVSSIERPQTAIAARIKDIVWLLFCFSGAQHPSEALLEPFLSSIKSSQAKPKNKRVIRRGMIGLFWPQQPRLIWSFSNFHANVNIKSFCSWSVVTEWWTQGVAVVLYVTSSD